MDSINMNHKISMVLIVSLHLIAMFLFAYGYFAAHESRLEIFGFKLGREPDESFNQTVVSWHVGGRKTVVVDDGDPAKYAYTHQSHRLKYMDLQKSCENFTRPARFEKLVFIVIDALRHDFIPSINPNHTDGALRMPFVEDLLREGRGLGLISEAATPTVTMPRIKALVSGNLPNFMDFILNLKAYKMDADNLLENAYKRGKRIVFYGDDTWLALFTPELFLRSNGTVSFFASDYIQVDSNVTDNAIPELKPSRMSEWDFMILHYLGVDHIGHAHGGFHSKLIEKKLLEMDSIIENIYTAAQQRNESYLIVITGDHGMTDSGNHGGNTAAESDTAFVVLRTQPGGSQMDPTNRKSLNMEEIRIQQIDIAPTISFLYDLPLPRKSRGKVSLQLLDFLGMNDSFKHCALFENSLQIQKLDVHVAQSKKSIIDQAVTSHLHHLAGRYAQAVGLESIYMDYLTGVQSLIIQQLTTLSIFSSISIAFLLSLVPIYLLLRIERKVNVEHSQIFPIEWSVTPVQIAIAAPLLHVACLGSTSFIEAEEYFWHYMAASLIVYHLVVSVREYMRLNILARAREEQLNAIKKNDDYDQMATAHEAGLGGGDSTSPSRGFIKRESFKNLLRNLFKGPQTHFTTDASQYYLCKIAGLCGGLALIRLVTCWAPIQLWLQQAENVHYASAFVICSIAAIAFLMSVRRFGKQQCLLISGFIWVYVYRSELGLVTSFRLPRYVIGGHHISANFRAHVVYFHVLCILVEAALKKLHMDYNWSLVDMLSFSFLSQASIQSTINTATSIAANPAVAPLLVQAHNAQHHPDDVHSQIRHRYTVVASTHTLVLRTLVTGWVLLCTLLHKIGNIPLFALHILLEQVLNYSLNLLWKDDRYKSLLPVTYLTLAMSAFYSQGNSNLFSTIDVAAGYVGLSSYLPVIVGGLMLANTYSLFVYWVLMMYVRLTENRLNYFASAKSFRLWSIINLQLGVRFVTTAYYMIVAIYLRHHLFVWSVLSPKYIYELFHTVVTCGLVLIVSLCHLVD